MMKTKKRTLGFCALAVALAATMCVPTMAFAAGTLNDETKWGTGGSSATENTATPEIKATDGTSATEVSGTIKATTLKVTVPTKVAFWVDPGATASGSQTGTDNKLGQFTNPTNFTINNYSAVDVYGYVSAVAATPIKLVNKQADLVKASGVPVATTAVMAGIADTNSPLDLAKTTDWLATTGISDTKPYYAFNRATKGKLAASADGTAVGGSATMTVRGAVKSGNWAEGENFTFTPTFKIVTSANANAAFNPTA